MLLLIPLFPLIGFLINASFGRRISKGLAGAIACGSIILSFAVSLAAVARLVGLPADEILTAAQDADMIVVGSRGAGGFKKLLMGSVSSQVTHHARCPVVVIPADNP